MTLTIDLSPQTEAWIAAEAEHLGVQPADLARRILDERALPPAQAPNGQESNGQAPNGQESDGQNPADMLLGLFSSPADAALLDEVTAIAYAGRNTPSTRDIGL